jgi:rhamnosyl/mannosyltransferase
MVGSLPELIEPDETGFLVAPNDSYAMAQALITLLKDDSLREKMGRKAAQEASLKFGKETHLKLMIDVYQNVVQNEHPSH